MIDISFDFQAELEAEIPPIKKIIHPYSNPGLKIAAMRSDHMRHRFCTRSDTYLISHLAIPFFNRLVWIIHSIHLYSPWQLRIFFYPWSLKSWYLTEDLQLNNVLNYSIDLNYFLKKWSFCFNCYCKQKKKKWSH